MIRITKPKISILALRHIRDVLNCGWLTQGPVVQKFERRFSKLVGTRHAVAVNSCTAGLHVCLKVLSIGKGDEVIVPAFTFVATANAVEYTGAKSVFVDIDPETLNIDVDGIEKNITRKTKAIIPVHLFGNPADIKEVLRIARTRKISLIEDAACAVGARWAGRHVGSFGVAGCFSFHPRKIITTGEGGMITTNNARFADLCRSLRSHGQVVSDFERHRMKLSCLPSYPNLGYNYRMSDIHAAIGISQMDDLKKLVRNRLRKAALYIDGFKDIKQIMLPCCEAKAQHVYQAFVIVLKSVSGNERNRFAIYLQKHHIATTPGTHSVPHLAYYTKKYGYTHTQFKNSLYAEQFSFTLPLFPDLSTKNQKYIISIIRKFFKQ